MGYDIEKEKREAIEAGQRALSSLRTAKENSIVFVRRQWSYFHWRFYVCAPWARSNG